MNKHFLFPVQISLVALAFVGVSMFVKGGTNLGIDQSIRANLVDMDDQTTASERNEFPMPPMSDLKDIATDDENNDDAKNLSAIKAENEALETELKQTQDSIQTLIQEMTVMRQQMQGAQNQVLAIEVAAPEVTCSLWTKIFTLGFGC